MNVTRADLDDAVFLLQREFKQSLADAKSEIENARAELREAVDVSMVMPVIGDLAEKLGKQQAQITELQKLVAALRAGAQRRTTRELVSVTEDDE